MSSVHEANDQTFSKEVLESDVPVLVDFWAEWCGPCRQLSPVIESIAEDRAGSVKVVKVNVDESPALAARYGINSIPAVYLFDNGSVLASSIGAKPKAVLEKEFEAYIH